MKHVLFISYDWLLDPLGKSQILPYLIGLAKKGYNFFILSYEKTYHNKDEIVNLKNYLKSKNINWHKLWFKKGRFQGVKRIINGAFCVRGISKITK